MLVLAELVGGVHFIFLWLLNYTPPTVLSCVQAAPTALVARVPDVFFFFLDFFPKS